MKSPLSISLPADRLWELSYFLIALYLFFFPCWTYPQSAAVALGGSLFLLFFRSIPAETFQMLGRPWFWFLGYLLISAIWSVSPGMTLQSTGFVFSGTLLFVMAKENSLEAKGRIEAVGLGLAFLASLMAVYQWVYGFEHLAQLLPRVTGEEHEIIMAAVHNRRAAGPFATHGSLAAFLILFIPVGFILRKTSGGIKRNSLGVVTLTLFLGLLATQSVGALLCLTLASLAVLLKRRSKTTVAAVIALGVLGVGVLISARGLQSWLLAALGTRLVLWKDTLGLFLNHPWLGTGLGTFDEIYQRAGLPMETGARFTHNLFLQLLVETGLAGSFIFIACLMNILRRLKTPARWEGWGAGTGIAAFLLFSLLDLPFQMPELVWFFAVMAGRMEFSPETSIHHQDTKTPRENFLARNSDSFWQYAQWGLLTVFLISGFWPPFRPWNFALLAVSLWMILGFVQRKFDGIPLWVAAGSLFLVWRAFFSPSALGAVWFLEMSGILLAFYLVLPCFEKPDRFMRNFFALGLVWALKVWWVSFHYSAPGMSSWIHFQFSDVKDWMIFPNPKQVGIFLIPLGLVLWVKPRGTVPWIAGLGALLTMARLKASSPAAGLGAGIFYKLWVKTRMGALVFLLAAGASLTAYRWMDSSATSSDRFFIWKDSCKVWLMKPLVGVGPGAFAGLYHQVKTPRTSGVSRYLMDAQYSHNEFLELLTAFGLLGFGFGLFLLIKAWRGGQDRNHRAGLVGLGAASFVDFCLHTPLIALQGIGLLRAGEKQKTSFSIPGAFLTFGLAMGLFGSPVLSGILKIKAETHLSQNQFLPGDLRGLETAERLNAWDSRFVEAKADYLEKLFVATKDPLWGKRSDEAFERVFELEKADGGKRFDFVSRLSARLPEHHSQNELQGVEKAWRDAKESLPLNAFVYFHEGLIFTYFGQLTGRFWIPDGTGYGNRALEDFKKAVELEPNFAEAWFLYGNLLRVSVDPKRTHKAAGQARESFQRALDIYNKWKDEERMDVLEKGLVGLQAGELSVLKRELAP